MHRKKRDQKEDHKLLNMASIGSRNCVPKAKKFFNITMIITIMIVVLVSETNCIPLDFFSNFGGPCTVTRCFQRCQYYEYERTYAAKCDDHRGCICLDENNNEIKALKDFIG